MKFTISLENPKFERRPVDKLRGAGRTRMGSGVGY